MRAQMIAEWALEHFKYGKTLRMLIRVCTGILYVLNSEVLVTMTVSFNLHSSGCKQLGFSWSWLVCKLWPEILILRKVCAWGEIAKWSSLEEANGIGEELPGCFCKGKLWLSGLGPSCRSQVMQCSINVKCRTSHICCVLLLICIHSSNTFQLFPDSLCKFRFQFVCKCITLQTGIAFLQPHENEWHPLPKTHLWFLQQLCERHCAVLPTASINSLKVSAQLNRWI